MDDLWDPFDCQSTQGPVHDRDYFDAGKMFYENVPILEKIKNN